MEYIISIIWFFLDYFTCYVFCSAFLFPKKGATRTSFILIVAIAYGLQYFMPSQSVKQISTALLTSLLSFLLFDGSILLHFLCPLIAFLFSGIMDTVVGYGICAIMNISYEEYVWKKLLFVAATTISRLMLLLLVYLLKKIRQKTKRKLMWNQWLFLTFVFPATGIANVIMIFANLQSNSDLSPATFAYIVFLILANIAILFLIQIMERQAQKDQQMILMKQQMSIQTESIQSLEKSYREQRKSTHEFLHQIQTIGGLLEQGNLEATKSYITKIQNTHSNRIFAVNSHHPILDAILNQKYQLAGEFGIEMRFQVNDLSAVDIETDALVVLFSNLLENAIEACQKTLNEKTIICSILATDLLYISIRNTTIPVEIIDGKIKTTKPHQEEHGYGLPSVFQILDNLNAEYAINYQDGWFQFVAEIPLEQN